jgi:uncharacterized protein YoxC
MRDIVLAARFIADVRTILKDEQGEWRELNSCADAIQDISLALTQYDIETAVVAVRAVRSECTDSPACARTGCADCERSYGPQRGRR